MPRFTLRFSQAVPAVFCGLLLALGCQSNGGDSAPAAAAKPTVTLASGVEGGTYHDRYAVGIAKILTAWDVDARITGVRNKFENLEPTNYGGIFHNLEELYLKEEYR